METTHKIFTTDCRDMPTIPDNSVELVVTSPPYPMIEMWDDLFKNLNPDITDALTAHNGQKAFTLMHDELNKVWDELKRVVKPNGLVCINIGDATRKLGDSFQLYPNHSRIITDFTNNGFSVLPSILWRKPTNSAAKFMGSGMLPPNQYVTLEHEHILVFRNGTETRTISDTDIRRKSAYFYEERNKWFTDTWDDITGETQSLTNSTGDRDRSAAYPITIPYRLINMYSVYNDTVLDPFLGTGTTTQAAMIAGRNSYGYELDTELVSDFDSTVTQKIPRESQRVAQSRIDEHADHVESVLSDATVEVTTDVYSYQSTNYPLPVRSKNETEIQLYDVANITRHSDTDTSTYGYTLTHTPYEIGDEETTTPTALDPDQTQLTDL